MKAENYEIRDLLLTKHDIAFLTTMVYVAHYPTRSPIPNATIAGHIPQVCLWVNHWGKQGDKALIAQQGDQLLGAACYRLFSVRDQITGFLGEEIPVLILAVHPQYRRRGVGYRLLTRLLQQAKDAGFPALSLAVSMRNPARSLYEQVGFRSVQISEELLVTMRKSLAFSENTSSLPTSTIYEAC